MYIIAMATIFSNILGRLRFQHLVVAKLLDFTRSDTLRRADDRRDANWGGDAARRVNAFYIMQYRQDIDRGIVRCPASLYRCTDFGRLGDSLCSTNGPLASKYFPSLMYTVERG
jgi:hypothetical protein